MTQAQVAVSASNAALVKTIEADPKVQKPVADAKALGQTIASDALVFAHSVIGHVAGATPGVVADVTEAALAAFYDAVPEGIRGTVQAVVGSLTLGSEVKLDAVASTDVLGALGVVTSRIESWITEFKPTKK